MVNVSPKCQVCLTSPNKCNGWYGLANSEKKERDRVAHEFLAERGPANKVHTHTHTHSVMLAVVRKPYEEVPSDHSTNNKRDTHVRSTHRVVFFSRDDAVVSAVGIGLVCVT